jgi:hypothetical protein
MFKRLLSLLASLLYKSARVIFKAALKAALRAAEGIITRLCGRAARRRYKLALRGL